MHIKIAGQLIIESAASDSSAEAGCHVWQVVDSDLKGPVFYFAGWIPSNVIKFVATTALPNSFSKLQSLLKLDPKSHEAAEMFAFLSANQINSFIS